MKKLIIILLLVLTITIIPHNSKAAEQGTGLEVESPKLFIYIVDLSEETKEFGLDKQLIRSKVELALRQNDIEILNEFSSSYPYLLEVEINVIGEYSGAFSMSLNFIRSAKYSSGDINYTRMVRSYDQSGVGKAANDKNYIINTLENQIDIFINEFHKSNNF